MAIDFPSTPSNGQVYTYGNRTWTWTGYAWQATTTTLGPTGAQGVQGIQGPSGIAADIIPLDTPQFDDTELRFQPTYQGSSVTINNSLRLLVSVNGIVQKVTNSTYCWDNPLVYPNLIRVDDEGFISFSSPVAAGSTFDARVMEGPDTTTVSTNYPFAAADLLIGAF